MVGLRHLPHGLVPQVHLQNNEKHVVTQALLKSSLRHVSISNVIITDRTCIGTDISYLIGFQQRSEIVPYYALLAQL